MNWNATLVTEIRKARTDEREKAPKMAKREDNLLKLMSRSLYGEKVHYALELIQNAEDACSSSINFIFERDRIVIINDGEVFEPDDVDAICSVKPGRKKNKIGFFGVGFKSVFNVTSRPQIISSDFNFFVENFIYPSSADYMPECARKYYSKEKGSIFVLPQSEKLPTIPDLIDNFKEIDDKILLFLSSLKSLHFIDRINDESWSIEKPEAENNIIRLVNGREDTETSWIVFHRDLSVKPDEISIPEGKEGITDTRIIIAFPCDEASKKTNKGSTVYCYLPTKKRSDMPFLVQADFVPTVGRSDIQEIGWNKWLLSCLGELAADAVERLKSDPDFGPRIFDFIPLKDEVHESMMDILCEAIYKSLADKEIVKASSGRWNLAKECVIPKSPKIPDILSSKDLERYFGKPLDYIDPGYSERAENVLEVLGSLLFEGDDFVKFLCNEVFINGRKAPWFLKAYDYLPDIFDVTDTNYKDELNWDEDALALFSELKKSKFLLSNQGKLVSLEDSGFPDRLICFPQVMNLSEINSIFTDGEIVFLDKYFQLSTVFKRKIIDPEEEQRRKRVHDFLYSIGVKKYFKQSHVIRDVIIPKYENQKDKDYDHQRVFKLVNYIRTYWSTLESEVNNKKISKDVFARIRKAIKLRAYKIKDGKKVEAYMSPNEIYFPKRYGKNEAMEEVFDGVPDIYFLHPFYLNKEQSIQRKKKRGRKRVDYGWKKFAEMLGVWSSPIVKKNDGWTSINEKCEYDWIERKHSPSGMHEIMDDSWSSDIEALIEYCGALDDDITVRRRMEILWKSLSDNWASIYKQHCNTKYRYKYHSVSTMDLNTSRFRNYLRNAEWLPSEDDGFHKPDVVFLSNRRNKLLLGNDKIFTALSGNQAFLLDIGVNIEPDIKTVTDHIIGFKEANPTTTENEVKKFEVIYSYLRDKISEREIKDPITLDIRNMFEQKELIYIPRNDKSWWRPSNVFWNDNSKFLENQRGYIENKSQFFYSEKIKDFFQSLGVKNNPSVNQILSLLDELKGNENRDILKRMLTKSYVYINDSLENLDVDIEWDEFNFLTKNESFIPATDLFYDDDELFSKEFSDEVAFVLLPHLTWKSVLGFLKSAGFNSFKDNLEITKDFKQLSEIEGGEVSCIVKALNYSKEYLLRKSIHNYNSLDEAGEFQKITDISIYEAEVLKLNLKLNKKGGSIETKNGIEKEAYYSEDENRLYILKGTVLFSSIVAKELSRVFKDSANDVFPFLNSIISIVDDDEKLNAQLSLYALEGDSDDYSVKGDIDFIPERRGNEEPTQEPEAKDEKPGKKRPKVSPPKPEPKRKKEFIDPSAFFPTTSREFEPYKKTDGQAQQNLPGVKLREGRRGTRTTVLGPRPIIGRGDAEGVALQMVINYEYSQGRLAEDRHSQRGIGYDIYSKDENSHERFIEVKHFSEKESRFQLKPHQTKKAEIEGDKFFVYIVKGLVDESDPRIFIIQNPVQWLTPDPPATKDYSDWKNGVKEEIEFSLLEKEGD